MGIENYYVNFLEANSVGNMYTIYMNMAIIAICGILLWNQNKQQFKVTGTSYFRYTLVTLMFSRIFSIIICITGLMSYEICVWGFEVIEPLLDYSNNIIFVPMAWHLLDSLYIQNKKKLALGKMLFGLVILAVIVADILVLRYGGGAIYLDADGIPVLNPYCVYFAIYPLVFIGLEAVYYYLYAKKLNDTNRQYAKTILLVHTMFYFTFAVMMVTLNAAVDGSCLFLAVGQICLYLNVQKRREEALQRNMNTYRQNVLLSQMRPHFLYNSLSVIGYLCRKNPADAEQAVHYFSTYLKNNFRHMSATEMIPFDQEMEHTDAFLQLCYYRFGNRLNVVYDLDTANFMLPAFTLEPLVENSVRHGIEKLATGGNINISVKESQNQIELSVKDDGPGFDTMRINTMKNHGLINIIHRIREIAGGKVNVLSKLGEGTQVIITIPKLLPEDPLADRKKVGK